MRTIEVVYFNAGGGHRSAARALADICAEQGRPWSLRLVNLFDLIDPQRAFERVVGVPPEAYYNKRLATGLTVGLAQELKLLQAAIRWAHPHLVARLAAHWRASRPDLVVSVIPNFNRALVDSVSLACPGVPFVTVLTDIADLPPRFWIERDARQHLVVGSDRALAQAVSYGHRADRVFRVSGMVLRPSFYAAAQAHWPAAEADDAAVDERVRSRRDAGLDAHTPTGLVMFGGAGSRRMVGVAESLPDTPLILMCGRDAALARRLQRLPARAPRVVVGFTEDVPRWMRLADFFIGKPGPGSLSEAVHCGLPVITTLNAWTLPQERYNAEWVRELGVGVAIPGFGRVEEAVADVVARLPELRRRVASVCNRAVFEIPEVFATLLDRADQAAGRPRVASWPGHGRVIGSTPRAATMATCDAKP
ncbi:MAG: galactosyldiacylglycerol synthase [Ideonella sp.]|jgi:1,2-diacylglycerol 3-beta-galactosyltransferase|nr:galactosyldiacylglycerol synthase [Ideonella sp.]